MPLTNIILLRSRSNQKFSAIAQCINCVSNKDFFSIVVEWANVVFGAIVISNYANLAHPTRLGDHTEILDNYTVYLNSERITFSHSHYQPVKIKTVYP